MKRALSLLFCLFGFISIVCAQTATVTIPAANTNTSSNRLPYGSWYGYGRTVAIYTAAELGGMANAGRQVTRIAFYLNSANAPAANTPIVVYLKAVSNSNFAAATNFATQVTGATQVYNGNITSASLIANSWVSIVPTATFTFDGTSNLEVIAESNGGGGGTEGSTSKQFRWSNPGNGNVALTYEADNSPPTGNITLGTSRPNLQLDLFLPTPCAGMPTAGVAAGPASICLNKPLNLSLTGSTAASNIVIQWERRVPAGTGTWAPIPGANSASYSTTAQTVATDYRAKVTCNNPGGGSAYSNILNVTMNSFYYCYCNTSGATNTADEEIFNVTFNTLNQTSACGAPSNGLYTDYRGNGPGTDVKMGSQYPMAVELSTCNGDYNRAAKVYIDYNQDAVFTEPAELVLSRAYTGAQPSPQIMSGTVTIPAGIPAGVTGMRVVYVETGSLAGVDPCTGYGYGETEDYLINIVYAPAPATITATGNPLCSGENVTLSASSPAIGATYYWTGPSGFSALNTGIVSFNNVTTSQHGLYTVRVIVGQDTSAPRTYYLTVHQTPGAPVLPSALVQYCINDVSSPLIAYGTDLLWYVDEFSGIGSPIAPTINTSASDTVIWYVSQSNNGCEGSKAWLMATVAPKPPLPLVEDTTYYCEGSATPALTAVGENLKWYENLTGGLGSVVPPVPNASAPDTVIWYVSQTVAGCEGPRERMVIIITPRPNALIQSSRDWICQYDTVTLRYYGSANNITAYNWEFPAGSTLISGDYSGPFVIKMDSPGSQRITLSVAIGNCISEVEEHFVEVRPEPRIVTAIKPDICPEEFLTVALAKGYSETIDKFDWDFGGGEVKYGRYDTGPYAVKFDKPGKYYISVMATDAQCKSSLHVDTVLVHPSPDAKIDGYQGQQLCNGDSIRLSAKTISTGTTYAWSPVRFFNEYSDQPVVYARVDFGGYISLNVQDEFGCVAADSILMRSQPCCEIYFPNAFSPNGDGKNDVFRMINNGKHKLTSFRVLNRWGQAIFETANEQGSWDGTLNGKPLDMGTYHYQAVFKCDNKETVQSGDVILVR